MKKPEHPYKKHLTHKITLDTESVKFKGMNIAHAGRVVCKECKVQIKWLSQNELACVNDWDFENRTLEYFLRNTMPTEELENPVWLNVSYQQKDKAKALGARWNTHYRKWYIDLNDKRVLDLVDYLPVDENLLTRIAKRHNIL